MNHDVVLILCSFLLYAGMMWSSTRIANAIGGFSITISPIANAQEKAIDELVTEIKHG